MDATDKEELATREADIANGVNALNALHGKEVTPCAPVAAQPMHALDFDGISDVLHDQATGRFEQPVTNWTAQ